MKTLEERRQMKAGDERVKNGILEVWVVCSECGFGRWVLKRNTKQSRFTGRCRKCYLKVARQEMGIYYGQGLRGVMPAGKHLNKEAGNGRDK